MLFDRLIQFTESLRSRTKLEEALTSAARPERQALISPNAANQADPHRLKLGRPALAQRY
jgi:hypothetical protein